MACSVQLRCRWCGVLISSEFKEWALETAEKDAKEKLVEHYQTCEAKQKADRRPLTAEDSRWHWQD